mmetsp:Transcript_11020/g.32289  ORF Transcript_11020/g.32289 Transcript_11020/m.32289 type:complete len:365 (+) Transcript_11020:978-2072(+)
MEHVRTTLGVEPGNLPLRLLRKDLQQLAPGLAAQRGVGPSSDRNVLRLEVRDFPHDLPGYGLEELMVVNSQLGVSPGHVGQVLVDHVIQLLHDLPCQYVHHPLVVVLGRGKRPRGHGKVSGSETSDAPRDLIAKERHDFLVRTAELCEGPGCVHHVLQLKATYALHHLVPYCGHQTVVPDVERGEGPDGVGKALCWHVLRPPLHTQGDRRHHLWPLDLDLGKSPGSVGEVLLRVAATLLGHLLCHRIEEGHVGDPQSRKGPDGVCEVLTVHLRDNLQGLARELLNQPPAAHGELRDRPGEVGHAQVGELAEPSTHRPGDSVHEWSIASAKRRKAPHHVHHLLRLEFRQLLQCLLGNPRHDLVQP